MLNDNEIDSLSMKPRLFVLTTTFPRSEDDATPRFVLDLSKHLTSRFEVIVITPFMTGSQENEDLSGVKVVRYRYWWGSSLLSDFDKLSALKQNPFFVLQIIPLVLGQLLMLLRLSRGIKEVTVHAHWLIPAGLVGTVFKRLFRRDAHLVVTAHGSDVHKLRWANALKRWVIRSADVIVPVSSALAEVLLALEPRAASKLKVLSMGVDDSLFAPMRRDEALRNRLGAPQPIALFVGRLETVKGIQVLLDAIPRVLATDPSVKFVIVGYGSLEPLVRSRCAQMNESSESVQFLGKAGHASLPALYASSDMVVVPSLSEGFGLSVVEAMACGSVVVASDLPAIRQFIEEGKTGFLSPPQDASALADAIRRALKAQNEWVTIRESAGQSVRERFSWNNIASAYAKILSPAQEQ